MYHPFHSYPKTRIHDYVCGYVGGFVYGCVVSACVVAGAVVVGALLHAPVLHSPHDHCTRELTTVLKSHITL